MLLNLGSSFLTALTVMLFSRSSLEYEYFGWYYASWGYPIRWTIELLKLSAPSELHNYALRIPQVSLHFPPVRLL